MDIMVPDYIRRIKPYTTGKPLEELEREYGIRDSVKLASNENPLGPSPRAVAAIQQALAGLNRYPDGRGYYLKTALAEKLGVAEENLVLGNGSDEIIGMLARAFLRPGDEAVLARPSFLMYDIMIRSAGATPVYVPLKDLCTDLEGIAAAVSESTRLIFINNPNNPTGTIVTRRDFESFLAGIPSRAVVVVDEAYIEFVRDPECLDALDLLKSCLAGEDNGPVVLRTFSKAYGLAGLRIGYGIMPAAVAGYLNRVRQPFNTNSLAQAGALAALEDDDFFHKTLTTVHQGLDFLSESLGRLGLKCFPTQTNFFLIDVQRDADQVFQAMLREGVIVRSMVSYGYPTYIRVNAGLPEENRRLVSALEKVLG